MIQTKLQQLNYNTTQYFVFSFATGFDWNVLATERRSDCRSSSTFRYLSLEAVCWRCLCTFCALSTHLKMSTSFAPARFKIRWRSTHPSRRSIGCFRGPRLASNSSISSLRTTAWFQSIVNCTKERKAKAWVHMLWYESNDHPENYSFYKETWSRTGAPCSGPGWSPGIIG